jgi:azurin
MSHTKAPWEIDRDDRPGLEWNNHIVSCDKPNLTICFMSHDGSPENEVGEANARRIVACVNACTGLTTEIVEQTGIVRDLIGQNALLTKQRDDLLAALEELNSVSARGFLYDDPARVKARTAIARVKGGA